MISVKDIRKVFKVHQKEPGLLGSVRSLFFRKWIEKEALKKVSLQVEAGEILGLVGANGAGKTTLVKILAGIIHPSSGSAKVLGYTPWERKNEFRKQIALIMGQKAQLWWDLPAADCFLLLKEIYQIPEKDFKERLDYLCQQLQVKDQLKIQIRRLSLGERMKMELIATLLHQPKVVFLDEPTIGLDITAQRSIRDFLLHYRREHKPAMILTSHYMEDIKKLCERIVIIREGEFVYDGKLKNIVERFSQHQVISATIGEESEIPFSKEQILSYKDGVLKVKTQKDEAPKIASQILQRYAVQDLNIEEEDISIVIEKMMGQSK